jgi:hypothetical protein
LGAYVITFCSENSLPSLLVSFISMLFSFSQMLLGVCSLLNEFSVLGNGHAFVRVLEILFDVFSDNFLFLKIIRQLVDEFINVLVSSLLVQSFQVTQIAIFYFNKVGPVAGVVSIIGKYGVNSLVLEPESFNKMITLSFCS